MKVIAFVMFLITLFTVAYSVPTNVNPQSVKTRNLSTNVATVVTWPDQSAFFTINLGHQTQIQSFTSTYNGGAWTPNQSYLLATNSSKELCIFIHPENAGLASVVPGGPGGCRDEFSKGYLVSSLIWTYTVSAIDSLAYTLFGKIDDLQAKNDKLQASFDKAKSDYETTVNNAIDKLQSGVFNKSIREETTRVLKETLKQTVTDEVKLQVSQLKNDPVFIKSLVDAVREATK